MGKLILKDASVKINGVDLSDHSSKVTIMTTFNEVDVTAFGATFKAIAQGLGDGSITVDFFQDYAANSVDDTLWPLSQSGSIFPIVIKPLTRRTDRWGPLGGPGKAMLVESLEALQQLWPRVVTANVLELLSEHGHICRAS